MQEIKFTGKFKISFKCYIQDSMEEAKIQMIYFKLDVGLIKL